MKILLIQIFFFCLLTFSNTAVPDITADPKFSSPIVNITVPVGREATMTCIVHDLVSYKVAWLRVDTQTILTIQNHVITKNHRIGISHTEKRIWQLRIRDVKESDRGYYMCQINTDPMKSQVGYLDVVVSPDILDYPTSQDMIVREGENITLTCAAVGSPEPIITWRRERGKSLLSVGNQEVFSLESPTITIPKVNRHHMGAAFLCIASNGVPPTVSKRVMVIVNFPPTIWTQSSIVYTSLGQKITLECITESHPNSVNYWIRGKGDIVQGGSYETIVLDNIYKVIMKLIVRPIKSTDFGIYKCVGKNSLGESEETIKIHHKTKMIDSHAYQQKSFLGTSINKSDWVLNDAKSTSTSTSINNSYHLILNFIIFLSILQLLL